jgi:uncharacterized integral membrane protein
MIFITRATDKLANIKYKNSLHFLWYILFISVLFLIAIVVRIIQNNDAKQP